MTPYKISKYNAFKDHFNKAPHSNCYGVPISIVKGELDKRVSSSGRTMLSLGVDSTSRFHRTQHTNKYNVSQLFCSERLDDLQRGDLIWDSVKSIKAIGKSEVFDFTMKDQSMPYALAEDILVHNCIGKKDRKLLAEQEERFMELALQKYSEDLAKQFWNYIKEGAGYGFNKSHAIAYSLLSYKGAYLKSFYPIEFYCANMKKCKNLGDKQKAFERIKEFINDAKITGIKITPPSIRRGNMDFDIIDDKRIAFGLSHIHGVGHAALQAVQKCSGTNDFYEFVKLTFQHRVNRRVVEGVVLSGAADDFAMPRKQMLLEYQVIADLPNKEREYALKTLTDEGVLPILEQMANDDDIKERKAAGEYVPNVRRRQALRDIYEELYAQSSFHDDKEWNLSKEEEYLGCALSGSFEDVYSYLPATSHTCLDLLNPNEDEHIELCVKINNVKKVRVRATGAEMAFINISDKTYTLNDIPVFSKKYSKFRSIIEAGKVVCLKAFYKDGLKIYNIQEVSTSKSEIF
jgi:DNA polymerase-3 subunit alpha